MKRARLYKLIAGAILLCLLAVAAAFLTSFSFNPDSSGDASFIARAQQKSAPGINVKMSALGARESQQSFGEDLAKYNIQPVWLSIENETDDQLVFIPITMDPDYYSPYEVSYRFHGAFAFAANRARDEFFLKHQIASILPPHSTTTGFMYGVLDAGVKYAHVVLAGHNRIETFDFALWCQGRPLSAPTFGPIRSIPASLSKISNLNHCERHSQSKSAAQQIRRVRATVIRSISSLWRASRIRSFLLLPVAGISPGSSTFQVRSTQRALSYFETSF
jgi:hypothetical protein